MEYTFGGFGPLHECMYAFTHVHPHMKTCTDFSIKNNTKLKTWLKVESPLKYPICYKQTYQRNKNTVNIHTQIDRKRKHYSLNNFCKAGFPITLII